MNNKQVKRLRKAKKKLFSKANPHTKELLLKYEELESIERTIAVRTVYIQAMNDTLKKNKELDSIQIKINDDVINYIAHSEEVSNKEASFFICDKIYGWGDFIENHHDHVGGN